MFCYFYKNADFLLFSINKYILILNKLRQDNLRQCEICKEW